MVAELRASRQRERPKDSSIPAHRGTHMGPGVRHVWILVWLCLPFAVWLQQRNPPIRVSFSFPVRWGNASSSEAGCEERMRGWTQKSLAYRRPATEVTTLPSCH